MFPTHQIVKTQRDSRPVGNSAASALALDIAVGPARIRELLPCVEIVFIESPGNSEPNRPPALRNGLRPGLNVREIVDVQVVIERSRRDAVKLDKVDSPGSKQVDHGTDVFLGSRLSEIDLVVIWGILPRTEGVTGRVRYDENVLYVIRGAQYWIICRYRRQFHAGNPVNSGLLPLGVDMGHKCLNVREGCGIGNWASVAVETALPTRILC